MNDITRLLNDYAKRLAALPTAAVEHADKLGKLSREEHYIEVLDFVERSTRVIVDEMRSVADLYREHEMEAA